MLKRVGNSYKNNFSNLSFIKSRYSKSNDDSANKSPGKVPVPLQKTDSKRQTIAEIQDKISLLTGISYKYIDELPNWDALNDMIPSSQDELPVRSMSDSYDEAYLPFEEDPRLRDKYSTVIGSVRKGRLLEAMDFFSVWIVLKYILNPKQQKDRPTPYGIVTGHVDSISFYGHQPSSGRNIIFKGHVSDVGKSSVEVYLWIEQMDEYKIWNVITRAYFIMIARNRKNTSSIPVNKLEPKTEEEKKILKEAKERAGTRNKQRKKSLLKIQPTNEEQDYIHNLFIQSTDLRDETLSLRTLPPYSTWMKDTKMSCNFFPHPENRNFHLTLFGGYIMRSALEIAWITAMYHVKSRPKLIEISNITFHEPIFIGSFLLITGQVVYTEGKYLTLMAACQVEEIDKRKKHTTNTLFFTYEAPVEIYKVLPQTYQEAVLLLDGKRQFQHVMNKKKKSH